MQVPALSLIIAFVAAATVALPVNAQNAMREIVREEILSLLPTDGAGGLAVAVRVDGRLQFFEAGFADLAARRRPTPDTPFNIASLRKPFETTVLALAVRDGDMSFDDPVSRYLPELSDGGDIRRVTVGQLANHTSGLLLPQDHPPWPTDRYTLDRFLETLKAWQADAHQRPGAQHMYTHAGYILLQLALERGLGASIRELLQAQIFAPLGLTASGIPERGHPPTHAVQGYGEDGRPVGVPGDQQTYYDFPGTGQMYSSARDLAVFLEANMGEARVPTELRGAMQLAQSPSFGIGPHLAQGLAWEIDDSGGTTLVDKNGGLNNASAYMGMMPARKLGIVVLCNRGGIDVAQAGRRALRRLSRQHHRS